MIAVRTAGELAAYLGVQQLADTEQVIDKAMVQAFMAISGDRQCIHSGAGAIVPGNLLLSQLSRFQQRLFVVDRNKRALLAGYAGVRFRVPVPVGSAVRLAATLRSVRPTSSFVLVETECLLSVKRTVVLTATVTDLYLSASL